MRRASFFRAAAGLLLLLGLPAVTAGCAERVDLDKSITIQVLALDGTEEGEITSYITAPIFPSVNGKNETVLSVTGHSIRDNRRLLVTQAVGQLLSGKIQVILLTDKFLATHDLFQELNVFYRDPINPNNALLLYTTEPIEHLLRPKEPLRPMASTNLYELVEFAQKEGLSIKTTLERFNYFHYNNGMTAALSEVGITDGRIQTKGSVLLSKEGKKKVFLSNRQSSLLMLLRNQASFPLGYSFQPDRHEISFDILRSHTRIKAGFHDGVFQFKVGIPVSINLTEYTLDRTFRQDETAIMRTIEKELKDQIIALIRLCQLNGVDPVGFGMHARAYQYKHFRKVEDRWTEAFKEAEIEVEPKVTVKRFGIVK